MSTLKDLISGNRTLPDISAFNYAKTNAADLDKQGADALEREYILQVAEQIKKRGTESSNFSKINNLLKAIKGAKDSRDDYQEKRIKDEHIKTMQTGEENIRRSNFIEKLDIDLNQVDYSKAFDFNDTSNLSVPFGTTINPAFGVKITNDDLIEKNLIDNEIFSQIETLDEFDPERGEYIGANTLDVADKVYSTNAVDLTQKTYELYNLLRFEKFTVSGVKGKGDVTMTLQEAIDNGDTFEDGGSVSEALKNEIYSEIFLNLGGHKIPNSVLYKQYYPAILKHRDTQRVEEQIQKTKIQNSVYDAKIKQEFVLGITGPNAINYIAGTDGQKGTDGVLSKWSVKQLGGKDYAVQKIIAFLDDAERNDALKPEDTARLVNGEYYHKGSKEKVSLDKLSPILNDYIVALDSRVRAGHESKRKARDNSIFETTYIGGARVAVQNWSDENGGRVPSLEELIPIIKDQFELAKEDPELSTIFKDALGPNSSAFTKMVNTLPYKEKQDDETLLWMILEAKASGDYAKALELQGELSDPSLLPSSKKSTPSSVASGNDAQTKAWDSTNGLPSVITKYMENKYPDSPEKRTFITQGAKAAFTAEFNRNMELTNDPIGSYTAAYSEVAKGIQNGEYDEPPTNIRLTSKPDENKVIKDLKNATELYSTFENKVDFLQQDSPWPGELEALNYYEQNKRLPPYYRTLAKHFDNINGYQLMQMRMEKFISLNPDSAIAKRYASTYASEEIVDGEKKITPYDIRNKPWVTKESYNAVKAEVDKIRKEEEALLADETLFQEGFDIPFWSKEEILDRRRNLDYCPAYGNTLVQYAVNSKDMNYVFESLYNRKALKGDKYDYVSNNRGRKLNSPKPISQMTLSEVAQFIEANPNIGEIGMFGFNIPELASVINAIDVDPNTQLFDEAFQKELIWERIRFVANQKGDLATLNVNDFRRLSRFNRKTTNEFLRILKTGTVRVPGISWNTDMDVNEVGTDTYVPVVDSPWNSLQLISPALIPHLQQTSEQSINN